MFIKNNFQNSMKKYKRRIFLINCFLILIKVSFGVTIKENHINNGFIYYNHFDESNIVKSIIDKDNTYLTNNGTLAAGYYGENYNSGLKEIKNRGNGIVISNPTKNITIENNGVIKGMYKNSNSNSNRLDIYTIGNGIIRVTEGRIDIENNINKLKNSGLIQGEIHLTIPDFGIYNSGNGLYGGNAAKTIINTGNIIGDAYINISDQQKERRDMYISGTANGVKGNVSKIINSGNIIGNITITENTSDHEFGSGGGTDIANGISIPRFEKAVFSMVNKGTISGYFDLNTSYLDIFYSAGNGLASANSINFIKNKGIIKGKFSHYPENDGFDLGEVSRAGNGVDGSVTELNNNGIISGYSNIKDSDHGNGIYGRIDLLNNSGVIKGSRSGVNSSVTELNNNGIIIGQNAIHYRNVEDNNNNGIYITIDESGKVKEIENSTNTNTDIINAKLSDDRLDSFITIDSDEKLFNKIINGAGIDNGSLNINESVELSLSKSTVNAYKTALYMNNNTKVNAYETIFNGGGISNDDDTIKIKSNSNLELSGSSIVNGKIGVYGDNSVISIGDLVQLNGDIISNGKSNIIYLGNSEINQVSKNKEFNGLNIFHNINDFQEIHIKSNVILYESSQISTGDIKIEDGKLIVRVDGTKRDDANRITGHALYSHTGKIDVSGDIPEEIPNADWGTIDGKYAKLIFKTNGLAKGSIIAMGGSDISEINDWNLGTTSIVDTARKEGDHIVIDIKKLDDIFSDNTISQDLGPIYDSIENSDQLPDLYPTTDIEDKTPEDAKNGLLSLLDQIYANNPYTFVGNMSLESIRLYRRNIFNSKMPDEKQWITSGQVTHSKDKYDNTERTYKYGTESFSDSYHKKLDTTSILATAEYGVNENSSLGIAMGGSHQKLSMSNDSRVKGDTYYIGIYGKKKIKNFTLTTGAGYQYGDYEVNRNIKNRYQSIMNTGDVKAHSFDMYLDSRYTFQLENRFIIEPNLRISQSFINQRKVSEKTIHWLLM